MQFLTQKRKATAAASNGSASGEGLSAHSRNGSAGAILPQSSRNPPATSHPSSFMGCSLCIILGRSRVRPLGDGWKQEHQDGNADIHPVSAGETCAGAQEKGGPAGGGRGSCVCWPRELLAESGVSVSDLLNPPRLYSRSVPAFAPSNQVRRLFKLQH